FSLFSLPPPPPPQIYTLSLHDALPISDRLPARARRERAALRHLLVASKLAPPARLRGHLRPQHHRRQRLDLRGGPGRERRARRRSEEHTSELQSRFDLVCRLLLEKKKL